MFSIKVWHKTEMLLVNKYAFAIYEVESLIYWHYNPV